MTYSTRPPVHPRQALPSDELDGELRRFFRSEMPDPWPAAPRVAYEELTKPQPRRWSVVRFWRVPRQLAIAAAVALLVIGYLVLQAWFPDPRPAVNPPLDPNPTAYQFDHTKGGRKVRVEEHAVPNNPGTRIIVISEELPARK